jgi:hypothetical protein
MQRSLLVADRVGLVEVRIVAPVLFVVRIRHRSYSFGDQGFRLDYPRLGSFKPVDLGQPGAQPRSRRRNAASPCSGWSRSGENDRLNAKSDASRHAASDAASVLILKVTPV